VGGGECGCVFWLWVVMKQCEWKEGGGGGKLSWLRLGVEAVSVYGAYDV
jgi:hypothetical protein